MVRKWTPAVLLHGVDVDDIGMVHRSQRARFSLEALEALLAGRQIGREDLQGDLPPELGVLGEVDLAHAALAELGGYLEVRQCPADQTGVILTS